MKKIFKITNYELRITNFKRGYSLIEIVVYIAIFSLLSIAVINSLIVTMKSFSASRTNRDLQENGFSAMERMSREVRGAISVSAITTGAIGGAKGDITLNTTDQSGTAKTVRFTVSGNALQLYENGSLSGNLTGGNSQVTDLVFNQITIGTETAIKITISIKDLRSPSGATETFYDSIIMRGSY